LLDDGGTDDSFTVRIEDETGLYNLNRLALLAQSTEEMARVTRLLRLAGLDPALAGPIADWVDRDTSPTSYPPGAEASQYAAQDLDHVPRNAPMATFRELALVLGVGARELRELRRVATVLPNVKQVNVNTAPPAVLAALSEAFDESVLATLRAQRCAQPFLDQADLLARVPELDAPAGVLDDLGYKSDWFRVRSTAHVGDVEQSVEAVLYRRGADVQVTYFASRRGSNVDGATTAGAPSSDDAGEERFEAEDFELPEIAAPERGERS
jgi:general secretion pathway protein K